MPNSTSTQLDIISTRLFDASGAMHMRCLRELVMNDVDSG